MHDAAAHPQLIERDAELTELRSLLGRARAGEGALALVEGPAGQGKTALLRVLRREAAEAGFEVLSATAGDLELDFAYGVVRQLFEPVLRRPERETPFRGAAALAEPVFSLDGDEGVTDVSHPQLHGLFWMCANLAEERPLLIVVDDAHWADAPSLRFLDVLARRIEDLPALLAVGARPGERTQDGLLDSLAATPAAHVVAPGSLSEEGVAALLTEALGPGVEDEFVRVCASATRGNPFLLRELSRTLATSGFTGVAAEAEDARRAVPQNVARMVVARLRRISPEALAVARGIAVLGERGTVAQVAALVELPAEEVREGAAVLVRAGLTEPDGLRFIHPLVREAVVSDLPTPERSGWHRRAARIRADDRAPEDEVAGHLLLSDPDGDAWAAGVLVDAGLRALRAGAPDTAMRALRRALAEPTADEQRPGALLALGIAEMRAGDMGALDRLAAASEAALAAGDMALHGRAVGAQANLLFMRERAPEAVEMLKDAIERTSEAAPDVSAELDDQLIDLLPYDPALMPQYHERLERARETGHPPLLAHLAHERATQGAPAGEVLDLARRALAGGAFTREIQSGRNTAFWAIESLHTVDAADEALTAIQSVERAVGASGSRIMAGSLAFIAANWERLFGDLRRAEDQARLGLDLLETAGALSGAATLRAVLASTLLDRGELDEADLVLQEMPDSFSPSLGRATAIRGRLRFMQGRFEEAAADLETQLEYEAVRGWVITRREPTRAVYARVLAALGRADEALEVADGEVALSLSRGVAGHECIARMSRGSLLSGPEALEELRLAVDAGARSPRRPIRAAALVTLGSALRRQGRRTEAREVLSAGRDLAHRVGATSLERAAHDELVIAGARPRRVATEGVDALTAAERRVADLAASGLRNREIAETLFVTLKTVEVHLGHAYAKLGIKGRSQLAEALAGD